MYIPISNNQMLYLYASDYSDDEFIHTTYIKPDEKYEDKGYFNELIQKYHYKGGKVFSKTPNTPDTINNERYVESVIYEHNDMKLPLYTLFPCLISRLGMYIMYTSQINNNDTKNFTKIEEQNRLLRNKQTLKNEIIYYIGLLSKLDFKKFNNHNKYLLIKTVENIASKTQKHFFKSLLNKWYNLI